ncbi:MAG: hypothetical protein R3316_02840 [Rhodovibrionaceae bacterium]|nr:hypothetical protein [Rhodovibrionaceae bacterium]
MGERNAKASDSGPGTKGLTVREAVGVLHDAESLERTVEDLLSHGFDRAAISLLAGEDAVKHKLGHLYDKVDEAEDDPYAPRQAFVPRTTFAVADGAMFSFLFYIGAISAAGAMVASGGAAISALIAMAMGGGATGLIGSVLAQLLHDRHARQLQSQIDKGGLVLWVNLRNETQEKHALEILERHDAEDIHVHEIPA